MFIFLLSLLVVSFISLCFFKKKFWENRYLVLLISGSVALVATLTTNYVVRGKLETKIETIWKKSLGGFYLNDTLVSNQVSLREGGTGLSYHFVYPNDSILAIDSSYQLSTILIYDIDKKPTFWKIGYYNGKSKYEYYKDVYIVPSSADSIAYFAKRRLYYDQKPTRWIADFSLPHIKNIKCFYIPPSEYAIIPDSLIRKLPF